MALTGPLPEPAPPCGGPGDRRPRARARIGLTINGKYRLDSLLGVGGMASVYAATHRNGTRAALKILHTEFARDTGDPRRASSAKATSPTRSSTPARVAIDDDDVTEEATLPGDGAARGRDRRSSSGSASGRKLPVDEVPVRSRAELLDTLEGFHDAGHRPPRHQAREHLHHARERRQAARLRRRPHARGRRRGAPAPAPRSARPSFMAPEQAMGLADGVDGRADIFSVGATLYAMLSGAAPPPGAHRQRGVHPRRHHAGAVARPRRARPPDRGHLPRRQGPGLGPAQPLRGRRGDARRVPAACSDKLGGAAVAPRGRRGQSAAPGRCSKTRAPGRAPRQAAAAMPIVEEIEAEVHEDADADDPGVKNLIDVFRTWERLLPAIRHYGWAHPEIDNKLRATYQKLIEALRADPGAVCWKPLALLVRPPRPDRLGARRAPLDAVPYNLFAAGIPQDVRLAPASPRTSSAPSARSCSSTPPSTSPRRTTWPPRSGRSASITCVRGHQRLRRGRRRRPRGLLGRGRRRGGGRQEGRHRGQGQPRRGRRHGDRDRSPPRSRRRGTPPPCSRSIPSPRRRSATSSA